jgi:hypothetical protein
MGRVQQNNRRQNTMRPQGAPSHSRAPLPEIEMAKVNQMGNNFG